MSVPMDLCEELIRIFGEEMREVFRREDAEPEFLNSKDYLSSFNRAEEAYEIATIRGKKILALADAVHQAAYHSLDTSKEQTVLEDGMSEEDKEVSTKGFWGN